MRTSRTVAILTIILFTCSATTFAAPKEVAIPNADAVVKSEQVFKTIGDVKLKMHIYFPRDHKQSDQRPAIVFFFGGGWTGGSPKQFDKQCTYLAGRGMVAMAAEYRVKGRHGVEPDKCLTDANSAIRWVRKNAKKLGVDPDRIASGGGSAGGHLGAAVALCPGFDEPDEDEAISSKPNAMVLFNPALDTTAAGWGGAKRGASIVQRMGGEKQAKALSPQHHVRKDSPPAIVFHGKADPTVPYAQADAFAKAMKAAGNRCDLHGYDRERHGFFNYGRGDGTMFVRTMIATDRFLESLGWLKGEPTLKLEDETKP